jgi:hypothetical protein
MLKRTGCDGSEEEGEELGASGTVNSWNGQQFGYNMLWAS